MVEPSAIDFERKSFWAKQLIDCIAPLHTHTRLPAGVARERLLLKHISQLCCSASMRLANSLATAELVEPVSGSLTLDKDRKASDSRMLATWPADGEKPSAESS
jgi:hypothetical protein